MRIFSAVVGAEMSVCRRFCSMSHWEKQIKNKTNKKINWYPGHMAVANKQIELQLGNNVDVILEVRDARIPFTSANPHLDKLALRKKNIPRLVIFNKGDLANSNMKKRVQERLLREEGLESIFTTATKGRQLNQIIDWSSKHSKAQFTKTGGSIMMVVGIPNVGKSSIINALRQLSSSKKLSSGRKMATVGSMPGVTRRTDIIRVNWSPALYVIDTPGVMIPNIPDFEMGMRLALTGAIKDDIIGVDVLADFMLFTLNKLKAHRYIKVLDLPEPTENIEDIFRKVQRDCGGVGKSEDVQRKLAAEFLLKKFRQGEFGLFTFDHVC